MVIDWKVFYYPAQPPFQGGFSYRKSGGLNRAIYNFRFSFSFCFFFSFIFPLEKKEKKKK